MRHAFLGVLATRAGGESRLQLVAAALCVTACCIAPGVAQQVVQIPYSTHDWTQSGGGGEDAYLEAWADVKTPGDGRQYVVGTIEVRDTNPATAQFSLVSASPPPGLAPFTLGASQRRQVVMVQCTDASQGILWQRYFYGSSPVGDDDLRATNGRGISVWPTGVDSTTRVAICGETCDEQLPGSSASFAAATTTNPTGFIAVFDGAGNLLWTHHLFGSDADSSCAITDLSIRVESDGRETVTYCGISSHGAVTVTGTKLEPKLEFQAVGGSSDGDTDQGAGQWDGIVGRVSREVGLAPGVEFHSIVSSPEQDGLFGLAEIELTTGDPGRDRFAVVGATSIVGNTTPPSGFEFPGKAGLAGPFYLGTILVFDAAPTRILSPAAGDLILESIAAAGNLGEDSHTIARDVVVRHDAASSNTATTVFDPIDLLAVVGSTDDDLLFGDQVIFGLPWNLLSPGPQYTMNGPTDGFVLMVYEDPGVLTPAGGSYHGGPGDDGLTGVQGWSEYPDHFVVTGFTQGFTAVGNVDIGVESFFLDSYENTLSPPLFGNFQLDEIKRLRRDQIGGSSTDRPAVMGTVNATSTGLAWVTEGLGDPAGGGIAVDQKARVNVVGQTSSSSVTGTGYPVAGGGRSRDPGLPADAARTVTDMLWAPLAGPPAQPYGMGRTDGSGDQGAFVLPAGFSGGTTPLCALSQFGRLIGQPPPVVPRMLIEYIGPAPQAGVATAAILVSRPTAPDVSAMTGASASSFVLSGFQYDFPNVAGTPVILPPEGIEVYITGPGNLILFAAVGYPNQAIRHDLLPLPAAPGGSLPVMTVQVFCLIPSLVPGGLGPAPCPAGSLSQFTASPAMWLPL